MMSREERIELIRQVQEIRDRIEEVMDILLPPDEEEGPCKHPISAIEDISSMGEPQYRCTRCGITQDHPFTEVI